MNVNESDINQKERKDLSESEYEEDYLQDDIPIDEDEDDDGIISDNYENIEEQKPETAIIQSKNGSNQYAEDENIISMEHSDDI